MLKFCVPAAAGDSAAYTLSRAADKPVGETEGERGGQGALDK